MAEVKIIKATKGEKGGCGRAVEQIRVAAYPLWNSSVIGSDNSCEHWI